MSNRSKNKTVFNLTLLLFFLITSSPTLYAFHTENCHNPADTIFIPADTIRIIDTVIVFIDEPYVDWTIDFAISPFYTIGKFQSSQGEYDNIISQINDEINYTMGGNFGSRIRYSYNNFLFRSGIDVTLFRERVSHKPTNLLIKQGYYTIRDTVDQYFIISNETDTNWYYSVINRRYPKLDSTYFNTPYYNHLLFLEIPVSAGHVFYLSGLSLAFNVEWINSFFIRTNRTMLSLNEELQMIEVDKAKRIMNINFAVKFSFSARLYLTEKIDLMLEPYYRQNLGSIYKKSGIYLSNPSSLGMRIGLIYNL